MATYAVASAKHATLAAGVVDCITLSADFQLIEVVNRDGSAAIFFTIDGPDPEVGGDDTYVLPAAVGSLEVRAPVTGSETVIKLISSGTPAYSVQGMAG